MTLVMLIDADDSSRAAAVHYLRSADYEVLETKDGIEGLRKVFDLRPAAVVLDLDVPRMDGIELTRVIRAASDIPIIATGARKRPEAIIQVLDLGADDFIEKPFSAPELVARVRAAIRRAARESDSTGHERVIRVGDITIDREARLVTKAGATVKLTATEFRLLDALATHVGKVAPHRFLLSTVWGEEYVDDMHYLRIYVGYLRKKLGDDVIATVRGMGYRLQA